MPAESGPAGGTFQALRIGSFRWLWLGNAFSSVANWIMMTTMGWLVYDLTGSGTLTGGINAVRVLPALLVPPIAGMASDRVSRHAVVGSSQAVEFAATFGLAVLLILGEANVWTLFGIMLLANTADTFNMPARQTMVFDVVPRDVLANAVALSNLAFSVSRTFGPMLGGVLIAAFGPANNFFLQSCAHLLVILTVLRIRLPVRALVPNARQSVLGEMVEGYRFVVRDRLAGLMVLLNFVNPLFLIPLHLALLPIFAKDVFHAGASSLGVMLGLIGFGGLFGGLLTASLRGADRRGLIQIVALLIYSCAQTLFAVIGALTGQLWVAVPFLVIAGAAESVYMATNATLIQLHAPDHLRGRVVGVLQASFVMVPVGVLSAGAFADVFGAPAVGIAYGCCAIAISLVFLLAAPSVRGLRLSRYVGRDAAQTGASKGGAP